MLKTNHILSLALLLSAPLVAMENPVNGHKGQQQIITAVRTGNLAQLQELKRANPNIDLNNITDRGFPLILITAMQNKVDMMHYLLRVLLLNPNVTFNGQNALHLAASRGHLDMVKYLVEMAKFEITAKDNGGKTALDLAKANNKADVVAYLSSNVVKKVVRPLPPTPAKPAAKPAPKQTVKPVTKSCIICAEDRQPNQFITLGCGHEYCRECLAFMLDTAIKDKNTTAFKCPNPDCKQPLENDLHKISADHAKIAALSKIQLHEYLTKQETTKNCPTPNCGFSFINERADQFTMQCPDCKKEYCGKCLHPHNARTTCQHAEQERNLANDRNAQARANQQWLDQNTKPCPRCGTRTEKNGGCMHMTCRSCQYHYCWNCLGEFVNHPSYYECQNRTRNPINPQGQQPAQEQQHTAENAHLFFARDPRGFINSYQNNLTAVFAERFMRLSCEAQGEWTARIEQLITDDLYTYQNQMAYHWVTELERLAGIILNVRRYEPSQEGTFLADIDTNREPKDRLKNEIQQWIISQNPNDLIMFKQWYNGVLYCETSLSRERLQEVLNQAVAHFRNNKEIQQAPLPVRIQREQDGWIATDVNLVAEPHEEQPPIEEQPHVWGQADEEAPLVDEGIIFEEQPIILFAAPNEVIHPYISNIIQQFVAGHAESSLTITIPHNARVTPHVIERYAQFLTARLAGLRVRINIVVRNNTIVLTSTELINPQVVQMALNEINQHFLNR